jgi:hypothetical protein
VIEDELTLDGPCPLCGQVHDPVLAFVPTAYRWNPELNPFRALTVEWRGHEKWAVTSGSVVYDAAADEWEYEPQPSSRDDDFLARTRYSREEALAIGQRLAERGG